MRGAFLTCPCKWREGAGRGRRYGGVKFLTGGLKVRFCMFWDSVVRRLSLRPRLVRLGISELLHLECSPFTFLSVRFVGLRKQELVARAA